MASYIRYTNNGAIRNKPLNDDLLKRLAYLQDMGITAEVFSGGQDGIGEGDRRTGSTRHDHGGAGDMFFYQGDRRLDPAVEADRVVLQDIVRRGKQAGITGWGAGDGYMQHGSMHVGLGNAGVWGKGGKGDNAAPWLREAYYGSPESTLVATAKPDVIQEVVAAGPKDYTNPNLQASASATPAPAPTEVANITPAKPSLLEDLLGDVKSKLGITGTGTDADPLSIGGIKIGGDDGILGDVAGLAAAFGSSDKDSVAPAPVGTLRAQPIQVSFDLPKSKFTSTATPMVRSASGNPEEELKKLRRKASGLGGLYG
ncbi:hypothetical protein [Rhizobium sp. P007]|uniref:hypothetical protein n=1 Tax=Rhizobium sp. P007 TaxID=285908 RepID=UPI0011579B05|nr:hypothetical protein [Rhizobium sp. P007]CAD7041260.1 hypothetical protein RP007_00728 [Rhizobium sp. P007]